MTNSNKIILGTAQLGLNYGITNYSGKPSLSKTKKIIELAKKQNIKFLDTSMNYGDSQEIIGKIENKNFKIITKLPKVPILKKKKKIEIWINKKVEKSLKDLNKKKIYALLLHYPEQLLSKRGFYIFSALKKLKDNGKIQKIGISIYSINVLKKVIRNFSIDLVQAPFNIIDRRIVDKQIIKILKKKKIELHVRSIFLQGLLISNKEKIPKKFDKWSNIFDKWFNWLNKNKISKLDACLSFIFMQKNIDKVIIGIENLDQLNQLKNAKKNLNLKFPEISSVDEDLINPSNWS